MFSKNKSESIIDREQHEQLEYAHKRIKQKKKPIRSFCAISYRECISYFDKQNSKIR